MMPDGDNNSLIEVRDLEVRFEGRRGEAPVRAVNGVSFALPAGECVGLVGESGCGKSTLANALMGLVPYQAGEIRVEGQALPSRLSDGRGAYARFVQMVFQDPLGALNPRMRIGPAIAEVLRVHRLANNNAEAAAMVPRLLDRVGLASRLASRYPHEISGGQRQRVCIARALAVEPSVLIADEPVSALDVSVQVQILNLLKELQQDLGLTILFISHDLATVQYMCESVLVMYLGHVVERGPVSALFGAPAHPYTESLLSAVPDVTRVGASSGGRSSRILLKGEPPSPREHPSGCTFHPRCPRAQPQCACDVPVETVLANSQRSQCHFAEQAATWAASR
ncbi:MAG: peptide/nickel transport system ATP-binding protein [Candidatus Promineifilaceae bacterium]|jgi:peptide/nickel transport system ATP-binding protein